MGQYLGLAIVIVGALPLFHGGLALAGLRPGWMPEIPARNMEERIGIELLTTAVGFVAVIAGLIVLAWRREADKE